MAKLSRLVALATGILGLAGAAAPASADGYSAPRGYAAPFSWNGYYIGINGGYGFSGHEQTVTDTETFNSVFSTSAPFGNLDIAGGFGGLQIGANHQFGPWVLGLEADLQGAGIADTSTGHVNNFLPGGLNADVYTKNRVSWFGTVRPRLGYAFGSTMLYATGGLAVGGIDHSFMFADNFAFRAFERESTTKAGYVVGGGVEHAFSSRWSLKLEYQYLDFGTQKYANPLCFPAFCAPAVPAGAATVFTEHTDARTDFHTVRLGLNYKFDDRRELVPLK